MDKQRRVELNNALQELNRYRLSNSQLFDRSILWLSSAGLGFSFAFLRDFTSQDNVSAACLLILSWWAFGAAILTTLASILISQRALDKQSGPILCELERDSEQVSSRTGNGDSLFLLSKVMGWTSGTFYFIAIACTIIFTQGNI